MKGGKKKKVSPGVYLAPGFAGEGLEERVTQSQEDSDQADEEGVVAGQARVHLDLVALRVALQRQCKPAQHALSCILHHIALPTFSGHDTAQHEGG